MGIFKAFCSKDRKIYDIYSIRSDKNGYCQFLIYGCGWNWVSAKIFIPLDD